MKYNYGGQSTFGQTLFNSIAILLGIGMLSEPLAFAYAGWGMGLVLIIFYGFISCYTAKILAGIILSDPRLRSYADIGRKAFGPRSTLIISILFCLELFAVSVILVTLYADSLHSLIPRYSSDTYKLWGIFILIPTVFLPLSLLSYTSILGIISTILVVIVILVDGVSKTESPGSLWSPAETSVGIDNWNHLGIAFGLFMAGFSGHAVIPSLARDMVDPSQFSKMINWAFIVATSIYTLIACAGYLMFGNSVSAEISVDLLSTPGYNAAINEAALWMLVLSPLSKFALTTQPLNTAIQILLGIDRPLAAPEELAAKLAAPHQGSRISVKGALGVLQRIVVTLLSVAVSILVPEFSAAMAFLGSFSAFVLCVIGPIAAKVAINGRCGFFDGFVVILAVIMGVWGTGAAFLDA
ncbi:transmembrane amino acid transporter protein-domain-containing protein [Mycena epipterygia]|nr:transmembrane amino acid transporter protein-domain-containing protein [Mycena epipterygia]